MYIYALVMLIAGICVPVLAVLNAGLGKELGSAPAACVILSLVALMTSTVILLATGPQAILNTFSSSKHLFFWRRSFYRIYFINNFYRPQIWTW